MLTEKGEVEVRFSVLKYDEDSSDIKEIEVSKNDFTKEMRSYNKNYIVDKYGIQWIVIIYKLEEYFVSRKRNELDEYLVGRERKE